MHSVKTSLRVISTTNYAKQIISYPQTLLCPPRQWRAPPIHKLYSQGLQVPVLCLALLSIREECQAVPQLQAHISGRNTMYISQRPILLACPSQKGMICPIHLKSYCKWKSVTIKKFIKSLTETSTTDTLCVEY